MSDARSEILDAIRKQLHSDPEAAGTGDAPVGMPEEAASFVRVDRADRVSRFREMLESVGGTVVVVPDEASAATAVEDMIREGGHRRVMFSDDPLVGMVMDGLPGQIQRVSWDAPREEILASDVGLTSVQWAVAETGTLVLDNDVERHRLASLLPPVHVALLDSSKILSDLDELLDSLKGDGASAVSRGITLVTGPSRTADIELTLVVGVHGPEKLKVVVLERN